MPRPYETRDDEARAAIQAIIDELPEGHPARDAYKVGADAIELTYLVGREDLAEKLNQAWLEWYARRLRRRSAGINPDLAAHKLARAPDRDKALQS